MPPPKRHLRPWAEKRGSTWRARWPIPGRTPGSKSGFTDEVSALQHGWERMGVIARDGVPVGQDGQMTVEEWCGIWYGKQRLEETTLEDYKNIIEYRILPFWGEATIISLDGKNDEINEWEEKLVDLGYAPTTATAARSKFGTILTDAIKKLKLSMVNPCPKEHNRGRKTDRTIAKAPQKRWATALEALLVAERCAVLSRDDTDFLMHITMAYTAMRWGEAVGFELSAFHGATINVMQQLNEFHGQWKRKPPKDGSYRYEDYDKGIIAVDLPPFLQTLLRDKAREMAGVKCGCDGAYTTQRPLCDGRSYLFLSPNRRHFRRSGYAGRFRPAADGLYQEQSRKEVVDPRRPVLVDATGTWPGRVLKPAWPPARPGEPFEPPFGRGRPRVTDGMALASWTPIKPGLTPHSWRHGHKTWLAELGLPEIYQAKRLGHSVSGLRGVYTHVTPETRATAVAALQARWEESLKARAEIDPHSASPLLDRLLQVVAARVLPECSQTAVGGRHLTLV